MAGIDPTGAQDQVLAACSRNRLLARQLALAVDTQWVRRVAFGVRGRFGAVEHVVGRVVNQRDAQRLGLFGEDAGGDGIDGERSVRLALGQIDGGVGRSVDDQSRAMGAHLPADKVCVCQVKLVAAQDEEFAQALEPLLQLLGDLAVLAGDEDFHGNKSASISSLPT